MAESGLALGRSTQDEDGGAGDSLAVVSRRWLTYRWQPSNNPCKTAVYFGAIAASIR